MSRTPKKDKVKIKVKKIKEISSLFPKKIIYSNEKILRNFIYSLISFLSNNSKEKIMKKQFNLVEKFSIYHL